MKMAKDYFDQGDIIWLNFSPQSGHEQRGRRPALVVSNLPFNSARPFAIICPITMTDRNDPFHVRLDDRTKTSGVVLADQVRSLDVDSRDPEYIERAPEEITMEVLDIIAGLTEAL